MKAVILAAGEGKRLRPFTETMPKVMLPVANKPIIEHVVDALVANGINSIIIVVGYKKESIMQHFKDFEQANIQFVTQDHQLGTAHALMQAAPFIDGTFLVLPGDNIINADSISTLIKEKNEYAMGIKKYDKPSKYGMVTISNNTLSSIIEKPAMESESLISTGIYKFPPSIFQAIEEIISNGEYRLTTIVQHQLKHEIPITTIEANDWIDVVYPWDLLSVNDATLRKTTSSINGKIEKNVIINGPVFIGKNTLIHSGSYLVGPLVIGQNCEIGPHSCIFPSTTIGNNSIVRPFSEIRNSVIMNDVTIGSNVFLSHSVIGTGSMVHHGYSTIVGNAKKHCLGECIHVRDIGVMIAEDTIVHDHVVTHPGVVIGKQCDIASLKQIQNDISSDSKVM